MYSHTAMFNYSEISVHRSIAGWLVKKYSLLLLLHLPPFSSSSASLFPRSSHLFPPSFFLSHKVELRRTGRSGELVVDGEMEIANGSSPGNFTALNIHSTMLFVGGTPTTMPPTSLVGPNPTSIPPSALACFHALAINNRYIDLR